MTDPTPKPKRPSNYAIELLGSDSSTIKTPADQVTVKAGILTLSLEGEVVATFPDGMWRGYYRISAWEPTDEVLRAWVNRSDLAEVVGELVEELKADELWVPGKVSHTDAKRVVELTRHTGRMGRAVPVEQLDVHRFGKVAILDADVLDQLLGLAGWTELPTTTD